MFATFGCFGCELCGKDGEGYGVAAVRNPDGPVAVIGSHGECFAAMVKLASEGFTDSFLGPTPPERLGESFLALKRGLAKGKIDGLTFRLLDAVDGDSSIPQAMQRQEHEEMFVLLGDPALRLPWLRRDVKLSADGPAAAGGRLVAEGDGAGAAGGGEGAADAGTAARQRPGGTGRGAEGGRARRGRRRWSGGTRRPTTSWW